MGLNTYTRGVIAPNFPSFTNSGQMLNGWTSRGVNSVQYRPSNVGINNTSTGSLNRDSYARPYGPTEYGTGLPGNWDQR